MLIKREDLAIENAAFLQRKSLRGYTIFEWVFPAREAKIPVAGGFKNTRFHCITIMLVHLARVERIVLTPLSLFSTAQRWH